MLDKIFRIALREIRVNFNFLLFRACAAAGKSAPRAGDAIGTGRVGILRPDLIGDFVLFTEALKHYRALYPDSKL
jgi:hypothetical protein